MTVRLKETADLVTSCVASGERPFVALEHLESGTGRLVAAAEVPQRTAPDSGAASVEPGDVLFGKLRPYLAKTWLADRPVFASTELLCLRPRAGVDSRWLAYLVASNPVVEWAVATSDGTKMPRTSWEKLAEYRIGIPPIAEQRAIADYLDRETARIDALIEKKQRLIRLLEKRFQRLIDDVIWSEVDQPVPLMRRVQWNRPIMYGIVLPGPDVPDGVPIVKGGDVAAQRLSPDRLARTTLEIEAPYARARLHEADLVFAIRGGIGDVELVPPELEGANITQDVARVAPAADVDPKWLRLVLRSAEVCRQVEQRVTGATIKGLNIWDLKRVCVPPSGKHRQRADLARLSVEESRVRQLLAALGSQSSLLAEHRQALITAAVTGELETPGVAT